MVKKEEHLNKITKTIDEIAKCRSTKRKKDLEKHLVKQRKELEDYYKITYDNNGRK